MSKSTEVIAIIFGVLLVAAGAMIGYSSGKEVAYNTICEKAGGKFFSPHYCVPPNTVVDMEGKK